MRRMSHGRTAGARARAALRRERVESAGSSVHRQSGVGALNGAVVRRPEAVESADERRHDQDAPQLAREEQGGAQLNQLVVDQCEVRGDAHLAGGRDKLSPNNGHVGEEGCSVGRVVVGGRVVPQPRLAQPVRLAHGARVLKGGVHRVGLHAAPLRHLLHEESVAAAEGGDGQDTDGDGAVVALEEALGPQRRRHALCLGEAELADLEDVLEEVLIP